MNKIYKFMRKNNFLIAATALPLIFIFISAASAHEGHDHSHDEPASVAVNAEIETRSARIGDYEVLMKNKPLEPDTPVEARIFLTWAETNVPISNAVIAVLIERENAPVMEVNAEPDARLAGSYTAKIKGISAGAAKIRVRFALSSTTEIVDFGTADIHTHTATQENSVLANWLPNLLFTAATVLVLAVMTLIIWFGVRRLRSGETVVQTKNQTVST